MSAAIRTVRAGENRALVDLWVATWAAAMPEIDFEARRPWFEDHLATLATSGAVTAVSADPSGAILGFVVFHPSDGVVDQIAVAPAHQGRGVGRSLLDEAARRSRGRLTLSVNTANTGALRFYERQGFVACGTGHNRRSGLPIVHLVRREPGPG